LPAMMSAAAAIALAVTLLLLEAPGGALAQGAPGRGGNTLDRSILLEWRASSPQLQQGWSDESAPVSEWEGVSVDAEGRVVSIDLWDWDIEGDLPAELGGLTALKMLTLHSNRLTSVPAALGNLTALEVLRLELNQLTSVPAELGRLAALTRLDLRNNQLTTVPAALGNLKALTRLDLAWNPDLAALPEEVEQLSTTHGGICTINNNAPGGALAKGAPGSGGNIVIERPEPTPGALAQGTSRPRGKNNNNMFVRTPPEDRDRFILLEWRASSPQLQRVWRDEDAPVSAWEGVNVDAEGRVVSIDLWNWVIDGDLPAALGGLTALKSLTLRSSSEPTPAERDRSILMKWRASSPQLQRMWFNEREPVFEWEGVTVDAEGRVLKIILERKRLTGAVPAALGGLTALETLRLFSNRLTSVPAELGGEVQVDSITTRVESAPGVCNQRLKLKCDEEPFSNWAFNFNLRPYSLETSPRSRWGGAGGQYQNPS